MRLVIVESPYRGNLFQRWRNRRYACACLKDCLLRGEAPFASHLLYTQHGVLKDHIEGERKLGMSAGLEWLRAAHAIVIYKDRGISEGMMIAIELAKSLNKPVIYRTLS